MARSGGKAGTDAPKIGGKIRRMRREISLTQAQLADRIGVSPSYLNLIEHNRRKVTVSLLMSLAEIFEVDVSELAEAEEGRLYSDVMEALGDGLFEPFDIRTTDVRDMIDSSPETAKALLHLYDAYYKARTDVRALANELNEDVWEEGGIGISFSAVAPADAVSDVIQANNNFFPDLEDEADRVRREIGIIGTQSDDAMADYLRQAHEVRVAFVDPPAGQPFHRRFDRKAKVLEVSSRLERETRNFQLAHQIALLSADSVIEMLLIENGLKEGQAHALGRVALANYFAAALVMPYHEFLTDAREARYDIELLGHRWNQSFEQICHRLTTLNKPEDKGIPLHMLRVDLAGNISKRFTLSGLPIPRHGGACSRWNVYSAFMSPGVIQAQVSCLPDGSAYFCIARTVRKGGIGHDTQHSVLSIGLGCDIRYAKDMIYSDRIDLERTDRFSDIGVACRICERMDCSQRAFPPAHLRYQVDENMRAASPYVAPGWPYHHRSSPGGTR